MGRKVAVTVLFVLLAAAVAGAEATRTVRAELAVSPDRPFAVENLVGTMTVLPADGDKVVAIATVHAEDDELAGAIRIEEVRGEQGQPTLRVRYPLNRERRLRGPFGFGSTETRYDGYRVRVSGRSGVLLYADVEVRVPRQKLAGTFRNVVGPISAADLQGRLTLDSGSGDIKADRLSGMIFFDTGSGDVNAAQISGELRCDTGSGDVRVAGFVGERLDLDTGSGDIRILGADAQAIGADVGSGQVDMEIVGTRLRRLRADTGSGDVFLNLPANASFDLAADQGSGDLRCSFRDAELITEDREVVGCRRGNGDIRITVDTGSGDLVVRPNP